MSSRVNKKTNPDKLPKNHSDFTSFDKIKIESHKNLADSFFKRGEILLLHGDMSGLQLFDIAEKLDPVNADLFCQMGLSLLECAQEEKDSKIFKKASSYFKKSSKINSLSFDTWQAWGNTLYQLGKIQGEYHFFLEAKRKYQKALEFSQNQPGDVLAHLHWDFASVWMSIAKKSQEACDFQIAIDLFEKASIHQKQLPAEFWIDFGHGALNLGIQINDLRHYLKAFHCYKNAISISISSLDGWLSLAEVLKKIYEKTHDEDHFSGANECFTTAAGLAPSHQELFISWADMLATSGIRLKDPKRLRSAIEKCQKALHQHCTRQTKIYAIWAESLAFLGVLTEKACLLFEAQNKISDILDLGYNQIDLWYSYGCVLQAFGKYFYDLDYYYQAIEKFQVGLSLDRTQHKLWHKLAQTYSIAAEMENDAKIYERATKFYQMALQFYQSTIYHADFAIHLSKFCEFSNDLRLLPTALASFEQAINEQKNAVYMHPEWLFYYAISLDMMGDLSDDDSHYGKAIEIFTHVLMVDPEFPSIHYRLALAYAHLGELASDPASFEKALHHFRIAYGKEEENDQIILDWGLTLINYSACFPPHQDLEDIYLEAEYKIIAAARLGNVHSYYHLACLYSLQGQIEKAIPYIEKAKSIDALPPIDEIMYDEWLENLRNTDFFRNFITHLENR